MSDKIVIIGNGPAGMTAASTARLKNRSAKVTVIDTKEYDTFHPCAMPFVIGGYLPSVDSIIENLNFDMMKIELVKGSIVEKVDVKAKVVYVRNLTTKEESQFPYDKLIFCTGSKVFIPPIPGKDLENVFSLKFAEDAKAIREATKAEKIKKIAVVGGSAIGIEVASELAHLGKEVMIIEMQPQLMPFKISSSFAKLAEKKLTEAGVTIKTGMMVKEISGKKKAEKISFGTKETTETVDVEVVVLATGVRSNTELAKSAGLKLHEKLRAIEVNEKMETNIPDIYAAGDCITVNNLITNEQGLAWLAGPAVRQGRVAAINAAGGTETYPGSVNSFLVSSRTFFIGLAGLTDEQAKERGMKVVSQQLTAHVKPHYMPDSKEITLKLVADANDGKIIGVEAIGEEKVDVNINYVVMALQTGLTVYDLMSIDFCYAPAVSETIYPLVKVADAIIRRIERMKARAARKK